MGVITKKLTIVGLRGRRRVDALFDTGATISMLRKEIADAIGTPEELPEPMRFHAAVGDFIAREGLFAEVLLARKRLMTGLTVVADLTEDLILGVDFLQRWQIRLDPRHHRVILDPRALRLRAVGSHADLSRRR